MIHRIYRQCFDSSMLQPFVKGKKCVPWLGNFKATRYDKDSLPKHLIELHQHIVQVTDLNFEFNTWFAQTYETGTHVQEHKDPKNNLEWTYIAVFGSFEGARSVIKYEYSEPDYVQLYDGDVLVLPCTINGIQGPKHSVSEVTSGTRYAFIGNRITL